MAPPTAPSGATCKKTVPKLVPLMRASVTRTMSVTPRSSSGSGMGIMPHSGMPGPPTGPAPASTSTASLGACGVGAGARVDVVGAVHDVGRAGVARSDGVAAERLMSAPSGARLPRTTRKAPAASTGSVELVDRTPRADARPGLHSAMVRPSRGSTSPWRRSPRAPKTRGKAARVDRGLPSARCRKARRRRGPGVARPTRSTSSRCESEAQGGGPSR